MLTKCPQCFKVVQIQPSTKGSAVCACGKDLTGVLEEAERIRNSIGTRLRVGLRNGFVGAVAGAVPGLLLMVRTVPIVITVSVLGGGIVLGFVLAAVSGDRFLDGVDELL